MSDMIKLAELQHAKAAKAAAARKAWRAAWRKAWLAKLAWEEAE